MSNKNGVQTTKFFPLLHWEILDAKRRALLPKLGFLKEEGFYLGGGTALALQIGHRRSLDFDFYTPTEYSPETIFQKHTLYNAPQDIQLVKMAKGWINAKINGIEVTHFIYRYPFLQPPVETEYLNLASKIDIAAMKIVALVQRGTHRDFIDIYFLIKEFGLKILLFETQKKYTGYDVYLMLRALVYFDDADKDDRKDKLAMLGSVPSWQEIKKFLRAQVFSVQKEL